MPPEASAPPFFLVVRPADQMVRTCRALSFLPWGVIGEPVLTYLPVFPKFYRNPAWRAILATSPRAFDLSLETLSSLQGLPVYAVGQTTAARARACGFTAHVSETGTAMGLRDLVISTFSGRSAAERCAVYLRGSDVRLDLTAALAPYAFRIDPVVVYRSVPVSSLSVRTQEALDRGQIRAVAFFSPASARQFLAGVRTREPSAGFSGIDAFCFSPAVLGSLEGLPWARTFVSVRPNLGAFASCVRSVYGF